MNKSHVILIVGSLWIALFTLSNSMGRANFRDAGNTGAPCEDGVVCRDCHFGGSFGPTSQSFTLTDPLTGLEDTMYMPGKVYNAVVTVIPTTFASRYGFQATALDANDDNIGQWLNPAAPVQISTATINCGNGDTSRIYIEHKFPNFSKNFKIDWQAPTCDVGDITFYFIGNAVNNDGSTSGDFGGTGSRRIYKSQPLPNQITIDSTDIGTGGYLANETITIKGMIIDSNQVVLGANDSISILPTLDVTIGSQLSIYNSNCF